MKNKLNITILDFDDIKNTLLGAGQATVTYEIGRRFVSQGHSVTVISSKYPNSVDKKLNGIKYIHIGIGTRNIRFNNLVYILSLPFYVKKLNSDIIVECFTAPISTLFSPLFTMIPVVGLSTSFDADRFSKKYHLPFNIIERFGAQFYSYFIALTPYLAKKMKKLNKKVDIKIIPQGVSDDYFSIKRRKPEIILFLGRLDMHQKGIDLLLAAYKQLTLNKNVPNLIIAGNGPDKEKIISLIKKYNLIEKIKLVGKADLSMKKSLFAKSYFVAFPSRSEGFSVVSLEALASGNRIVAFDIPSLTFADSSVSRKSKPYSTSSLTRNMNEEIKQFSYKSEKICKEYAKDYSWDSVAYEFEEYFRLILNKKIYE